MNKAIVTLAVGERCYQPWQRLLRPGWQAWCERHHYDLVAFEQPLDSSLRAAARSPAWQKLLAMASPRLRDYQQVLWLDADVFVNPSAPDLLEHLPASHVAMARDVGSPNAGDPDWFCRCWSSILRRSLLQAQLLDANWLHSFPSDLFSYYDLWGFNARRKILYNTGVIAFSPQLHADLFLEIYHRWPDGGPGALYEMIPLNLELAQRRLLVDFPAAFNQLAGVQHAVWQMQPQAVQQLHGLAPSPMVVDQFLDALLASNHFIHFAGAHQLMVRYLSARSPQLLS